MAVPLDVVYEVCLRSMDVYRAAIVSREFHEYMSFGDRLVILQKSHTVCVGNAYTLCGKLHRVDGPALTDSDGSEHWYLKGKRHRGGDPSGGDPGPAVTRSNGRKSWYQDGKLHREDGPAITYPNGSMWWYKHGKIHREDGPAAIHSDGSKYWYLNGENIREDGPAIKYADGSERWVRKLRL